MKIEITKKEALDIFAAIDIAHHAYMMASTNPKAPERLKEQWLTRMASLEVLDMGLKLRISQAEKEQQPITNADQIRSMSDEELAELLNPHNDCGDCDIRDFCYPDRVNSDCEEIRLDGLRKLSMNCDGVWLEWLKEEVKE